MAHRASPWWGAPKNFIERQHERKIGWLELFYDLVYVAAISQITHNLSDHPSWSAAGYSFLLFSLVFWSWVNGSQYYDLHGNEGIRTRLLTFWQMLAVAAVAITIGDAYSGHHKGLAIALLAMQVMITYLWWSVGIYDHSHRKFNKFFTINYAISFGLIFISLFTAQQTATWLWAGALLLNLTPPLTGARTITREMKKTGHVFSASAAIVERFGLFTIIVLAESIMGIVAGVGELHGKGPAVWFAFMLAILVAFLLWSLYFDMTSEQETKAGYSYLQWLIFLHFPLLGSLSVIGACMKVLLTTSACGLQPQVLWMFCGAIATILLMILGLTRIMLEEEEDRSYINPVSRLLGSVALCILIVPFFAAYLNTLLFMGIVAAILFVPVFIGIRRWIQYKYPKIS